MQQAEKGIKWLTDLLELMGCSASVAAEYKPSIDTDEQGENYWLTIDHSSLRPHQIQALIGTDGVSIDAIQYLANVALNLHAASEETHSFYTIELNDYRSERQAELQRIAESAAEQVRKTAQEFEIKALSAADRRHVHMLLKSQLDLETFSQGKEPHRHLIVRLVQP